MCYYAAWYWRLQSPAQEQAERHPPHWELAIPLSLLTGLVLWLLASEKLAFAGSGGMGYVMLLWSPIVALVVLAYLTFTARAGYRQAALAGRGPGSRRRPMPCCWPPGIRPTAI